MKINTRDMRNKIIRICQIDRRCADDDKRLISMVWNNEGWYDPELYHKLCMVSNPETIRRTRQKLIQEGLIKPSDKAQEHRYQEYKRINEEMF